MGNWLGKMRVSNLAVTMACAVFGLGLWLVFGRQMPPEVPLFYSRPWGDSQLVKPYALLLLPAMSIVIGLGFGWLAGRINREEPLSGMLLATSMVAQLVLILGMLRIVLIVI